ncbi:MAG: response regulator, partial [Myxococcota bacterium]
MTQHILLVEDCEEQATLLSRWLSKDLNVTVAIATSAEQALARADLKRFHVIIADLCLPDMDGLGLIAELKKRVPLTPLVLATAHATLDAAVAAANLGVFRFIQKPMGRAGYCQTVQE